MSEEETKAAGGSSSLVAELRGWAEHYRDRAKEMEPTSERLASYNQGESDAFEMAANMVEVRWQTDRQALVDLRQQSAEQSIALDTLFLSSTHHRERADRAEQALVDLRRGVETLAEEYEHKGADRTPCDDYHRGCKLAQLSAAARIRLRLSPPPPSTTTDAGSSESGAGETEEVEA